MRRRIIFIISVHRRRLIIVKTSVAVKWIRNNNTLPVYKMLTAQENDYILIRFNVIIFRLGNERIGFDVTMYLSALKRKKHFYYFFFSFPEVFYIPVHKSLSFFFFFANRNFQIIAFIRIKHSNNVD